MGARHSWSQESLIKGLFPLSVIDANMNTADMGQKYWSATTRKTSMALMPLCFGERLGLVTVVVASREAVKTSDVTTAAYGMVHNTTVDASTAVHCWWIFVYVNLVMVIVAVI